MTKRSVWVVMEWVWPGPGEVALIADTLDAAKAATARYVAAEEPLTWQHRNSTFDSQDYLVATHDGDEYHAYEMEVETDG